MVINYRRDMQTSFWFVFAFIIFKLDPKIILNLESFLLLDTFGQAKFAFLTFDFVAAFNCKSASDRMFYKLVTRILKTILNKNLGWYQFQ